MLIWISYAGPFSLEDLDSNSSQNWDTPPYESELLTAEEKAAYYENIAANGDKDNPTEIARDCKKKASAIRRKIKGMSYEEAKPLFDHAKRLENLAEQLLDITPDDVLEAQRPVDEIGEKIGEIDFPAWLAEFLPNTNEEKAAFWRNIHNWDQEQQILYYFGKTESVNRTEVLFVRAQKDPFALKLLAGGARHSFERLFELAGQGNVDAVKAVTQMVEDFVRTLNLYARANPAVFLPVTRSLTHWPVMHSTHPKLRDDPALAVASVQLGKDYPHTLEPQADWDPWELGCRIALHLFKYIERVKNYPDRYKSFPYCEDAKQLPSHIANSAASQWWKVAKQALEYGIPELTQDSNLAQLAQGEATRKFPARMKARILERLESRFLKLFPKRNR